MSAKEFLTPAEVGKILCLSTLTVRKLIARGELPAINVGGITKLRWKISQKALDEFCEERGSMRTVKANRA